MNMVPNKFRVVFQDDTLKNTHNAHLKIYFRLLKFRVAFESSKNFLRKRHQKLL